MNTRHTSTPNSFIRNRNLFTLFVVIAFACLGIAPLFSVSSASYSRADRSARLKTSQEGESAATILALKKTALSRTSSSLPTFNALLPQIGAESVTTYASDCTTPQSDFNLGDTVCAKATGVPTSLFPWRITWVDPAGFIRQSDPASTSDQTTYTYTLPSTATSQVNDQTIDNRGTWRVNLTRPNGAVRQTARFVVHEVANPQADVLVQKFQRDANDQIHAGDNVAFIIVVSNTGPDTSVGVHLADSVPAGGTLVSFTQNSGSTPCTPVETGGPANDCAFASMVNGDRAEFTAIYGISASASPGTYETSASVSSTTPDPNNSNNSSTAQYVVQSGSSTSSCDLTCPSDITISANTTEGGQRGAHVNYTAPVGAGTCGSISSTPASGSFFPVGTTIVTASSETGSGSCQFSVTVEESNGNVTIACPANQEANANNDCEATVTLGNPTTTGNNVTISVSRSDGKPMYDCDVNGVCTRKTTDLPFSAGITTVTWVATSHDTPGPYADPADEEAHRTGNASCQQTVTVNDVTPPVITAVDSTVSADANCQAAVPDYSNSVTDNCSCAANDNSQDCVGQHVITTTQNPAAGTLVGPGAYTIHVTANDGSSNNGGAGNTSTKDITFTVKDTTAPMITCPANITTNTDPGTCSATVNPGTATATDNCDTNPTVAGTRSDNQPLSAPYPKGTTTITWTATDHASPANQSSCTQTVTVQDHEAPVITCPANITRSNDPGQCSANINPGTATATDNCDTPTVTGTRSDNQALNAPYPVGTTTITWTATDSSNNSSSCTQTVTVNDTEPPTITTNGQTPVLWPANHVYHTFNVTDFVTAVSDNCDSISVSDVVITQVTSDEVENSNGSGNTLNDIVIASDCKSVQLRAERENAGDGRVYTITFKLTDTHGNVTTKTSQVQVPKNLGVPVVDSGPHYTVNGTCP